MDIYEQLITEAEDEVTVVEKNFKSKAKGLCVNNKIAISKSVYLTSEKACILAEELGHYYTTHGNILDQKKTDNRKQEKRAHNWAYEKLVPLDRLIAAYEAGVRGRHELALYLDIIEEFLEEAIKHYVEKYGPCLDYSDRYIIYFDPLGVFRRVDI